MNRYIQLGLLSFVFLCHSALAEKQTLNRIVALVNEGVVTQSEVDRGMNIVQNQMMSSNMPVPPKDELRKQVLNQLVNRELELQIADQVGIKITDADIDKGINMIAKNNNITVEQMYGKLAEEGMKKSEYRKQIADQMKIQRLLQQEVGSKISVTPEEIAKFKLSKDWQPQPAAPAQYHVIDVLTAVAENATPEELANAKIASDLAANNLRKGNSDASGEDLGWRPLSEIPSLFANALTNAQQNDVIGPIQAPNGFHILRVVGVKAPASTAPTKVEIQEMVFQQKYAKGVEKWVGKMRSEALINLNPAG